MGWPWGRGYQVRMVSQIEAKTRYLYYDHVSDGLLPRPVSRPSCGDSHKRQLPYLRRSPARKIELRPGLGGPAVEDPQADRPAQGHGVDHGGGGSGFAPFEEESGSRRGSGPRSEVETPQGLLHAVPVVDARHHLLTQVAPLGIAHRFVFRPSLLREVLRPEVASEPRDARLGAQHLQGVEAGGDDAGKLQQVLQQGTGDGGGHPEGPRLGAEPAGALERHLGAVNLGAEVTPIAGFG